MKFAITLLLFIINLSIYSQEKFSKEISLITDNDLYTSFYRDRYYTNGLFLNYRYVTKDKNEKLEKRIFEWQIGQEMFTPAKKIQNIKVLQDRPFAAFLFAGFKVNRVYKNNSLFSTELQLGVIGPEAFGKEAQEFIHNFYGFEEATGWKYQINTALGLNLNLNYTTRISNSENNMFDLFWVNQVRLGTVYTSLATGVNARFGFEPLQKLANSIAFNTNLNNKNTSFVREIESFFYLKPMFRYAFYDATIQGSILNDNNPVTKELIPFVFHLEMGIKFTANRFNFGYEIHYHTNKSEGLIYNGGNFYGRFTINYLLR